MGAAVSSNVASAVTNVVNKISNETATNSAQVQNIVSNISFTNCDVKAGSMDVTSTATNVQKSNQIVSALQNTHVKNDLQQKLLQAAQSTVGSLGIGFAEASNSATMMANSSTDISNQMNTVSSQVSNSNNSFTCEDSTFDIAGKFDINLLSDSDFLSTQTVKNDQIATIVNKITQTADQKASATVEGMGAALLCMAILIIAIGWSFSKTVTSVANNEGAKKIWLILGFIIVIALVVVAYLRNWPPFFGKTNECIINDTVSGCVDNCINFVPGSIAIKSTPPRYSYPLTSTFMPSLIEGVNLLQMAILVSGGNNCINGGYNKTNCINLQNRIKTANDSYAPLINNQNLGIMPDLLLPDTVLIPNAFLNNGTTDCCTCTPGAFIKNIPGGTAIVFGQTAGGQLNCPETGTLAKTPTPPSNDYIMANLNNDGLNDWLNGNDSKSGLSPSDLNDRALFARFVLCDIIGTIPLNIYITDNELVKYIDNNETTIVSSGDLDAQKYCYKFIPYNPYDFKSSCITGGEFSGQIGVCNDKDYKLKSFSNKWGLIILGSILGIVLLVLLIQQFRSNSANAQTNK